MPLPSRQERRKAERDAVKRAPRAGAAGAAGAAAALAALHVNQVGDWTTQAEHPKAMFEALGARVVRRKAGEGDREAQFSLGCQLMHAAEGAADTPLDAAGRSVMADAGLASRFALFTVAYKTELCVDVFT